MCVGERRLAAALGCTGSPSKDSRVSPSRVHCHDRNERSILPLARRLGPPIQCLSCLVDRFPILVHDDPPFLFVPYEHHSLFCHPVADQIVDRRKYVDGFSNELLEPLFLQDAF